MADIYNTNSAQSSSWGDYVTPIVTTAANIGYNIWQTNKQNKFNAQQAELNRQFNAEEAQKARDYETEMSNTAVTRAMEDYKNAGMNPHLATGGGPASTPAGSAASGSAATSAGMMPMNFAENMNTALTHHQIANLEANTALANKQAGKTKAETEYTENKTALETALNEVQQDLIKAQTKDAKEAAAQKRQLVINQMIQNIYEHQTGQRMPSGALEAIAGHIAHALTSDKNSIDSADTIYQLMQAEINNYTRQHHK